MATMFSATSVPLTTRALLDRLRRVRNAYSAEATREKLALLSALDRRKLASLRQLIALHEDLLFLTAFPDNRAVHAAARAALNAFHRRARALGRARLADADDSGLTGTTSRNAFVLPIARWLVERFPTDVEIDWPRIDDTARLDTLLRLTLLRAEDDAFDSGEVSTEDFMRTARGDAYPTDLAWLLAQGDAAPTTRRAFGFHFESVELPIAWRMARAAGATTHNILRESLVPGGAHVFRTGMRKAPPDAVRHIATPLKGIELLPPARAREVIDMARAALTARCREVHAISYANEHEVWLADLGEGAAVAIIGDAPEQRLNIEANYGYVLMSNGVPIGYGGVSPLFHQANTGINIFDPFRQSEAAFLWTQMLRAFATLFGVSRFVVNPYQFGEGNAEAIASGAFWFYYRLGFRPAYADTRALAEAEAATMAADRTHRSSAATLHRLANGDLHLDLPGARRADLFDETWLVTAGRLVTARVAQEAAGSRVAAERASSDRVARTLGARARHAWPVAERRAFQNLAPVVELIPNTSRWSTSERTGLVALMRAKGRPQERDFVVQTQRHPRWMRELMSVLRRNHAASGAKASSSD